MELLLKFGQLSNVVIFKAPHATDPGKPEGSHFIVMKNRDSMPSSCRGNLSHATDHGKPEGSHFIVTKNRDCRIESARQAKQAMRLILGNQKAAISL